MMMVMTTSKNAIISNIAGYTKRVLAIQSIAAGIFASDVDKHIYIPVHEKSTTRAINECPRY